ncbi:MAG: hypothetical protein ABJN62_07990 [Halioglobus sp.]
MTRYLAYVGGTLLLVICTSATFNYYADSLLLYHYRGAGDAKLNRVDQFDNMRFSKPYHVLEKKPDAIIIGSSRSGTIIPKHKQWRELVGYNFSLPGITLEEINRSVRHAHANHPLSKLMIGLDFQAIVSPLPNSRPGFKKGRLVSSAGGFYDAAYIGQYLKDLLASLLSLDITGESLAALSPPGPRVRKYFSSGTWRSTTNQLTGRGGYIFSAKNTLETRHITPFEADTNLAIYEDLLRFCYSNNIDTRLFLTPTHVFVVDLWFGMTSEELWRDTHRRLIAINERLAKEYGKAPFTLRGFGDEAQVVDEPIYLARNIERAWFDDGVHYRSKMAKGIMKGVWDIHSEFGKNLNRDNIEQYLNSIDEIRGNFMLNNQDIVSQLHAKINAD